MAEETEEGRIATIDEKIATAVEAAIGKLKDVLTGSSGGGQEAADPASMSEEVRRQVEKLRADEERVRRESERDAEVADLKQKVNAERPPREYRRATKLMRWDTEADR